MYRIAIDGPSGSGKSTVAKLIAEKLGFLYIDSGAMYRAVTLYLIEKKLLNESKDRLSKHIKKIKINFVDKNGKQLIFLNGRDVSKQIRTSKVSNYVSEVSSKKVVRTEMVKRQRAFAKQNPIVMDGRDIGSNVFKNANLKIYLTASPYIRAKRRQKDLQELSEYKDMKTLLKEIQSRDNFDSSRSISPLLKAQDAVVIDSSNLIINEVLQNIYFFLPEVKYTN